MITAIADTAAREAEEPGKRAAVAVVGRRAEEGVATETEMEAATATAPVSAATTAVGVEEVAKAAVEEFLFQFQHASQRTINRLSMHNV